MDHDGFDFDWDWAADWGESDADLEFDLDADTPWDAYDHFDCDDLEKDEEEEKTPDNE